MFCYSKKIEIIHCYYYFNFYLEVLQQEKSLLDK